MRGAVLTVAFFTLFLLVATRFDSSPAPAQAGRAGIGAGSSVTGCTTDFDCARSGVVGYGVDASLVRQTSDCERPR